MLRFMTHRVLNQFGCYVRQRYTLRYLSVVVIMAIVSASLGACTWVKALQWIPIFAVLLLPFRLMDDLCSLVEDRRHFPQRLLCTVSNTHPFWVLCLALVTINSIVLLLFRPLQSTAYLLLFVFLWWQSQPQRRHFTWALIKYPIIILIFSALPLTTGRLWFGLTVFYGALVAFDYFDDERNRFKEI